MSLDSAKGVLIPIGGNEDKGEDENYTLDFIAEGILSHVVKESGGKEALIIIIPTASSIPEKVSENYVSAFEKLGCTNIKVLDIRSTSDSENSKSLDLIRNANCVMFSGGNQSKITKAIAGTRMHDLLHSKYLNEKFVIAGTSAGAMAMSEDMIAGGSSVEALLKGAIKMQKGLGFISDLVIDSHFIRRGRFGRLAEAMAMGCRHGPGTRDRSCGDPRMVSTLGPFVPTSRAGSHGLSAARQALVGRATL